MAGEHRITDPGQLSDLSLGLSRLRVCCEVPSASEQRVILALVQPLSKEDLLAACRTPGSKILYRTDGNECGTTLHEYLNLEPVGTTLPVMIRESDRWERVRLGAES